jgi:HlyD family secretion protein
MKTRKYLKYVIIAVLLIAAVVAYTIINKKKNMPEWKTSSPTMGSIREIVTATGSLNPTVLVEVGTEVSGKIEKLYKDFNDTVKKGELLARLDTEILATNLESARAEVSKATLTLNQARLDYQNNQELVAKGYAPQYDLQQSEYAFKQAQQSLANANISLQRAQKNLQNASITSPIDGVIVSRAVSEGQTVAASMSSPTLFTIANNLDQMEITASVDEADIGKIAVGMPVEFTVDAYAGEQFEGSVQQIRLQSTVEQNVVSYSVIIDAANPEHKLLPGMTTNVSIIVQSKENVTRISESATRFTPSKEVWELFGLKWEDDMISNARKAAMQQVMGGQASQRANSTAGKTAQSSRREDDGTSTRAVSRAGGPSPAGSPATYGNGRSSAAMIWVLNGKTPELRMIRTGVSDGANIEVLSDLGNDIKIITGVIYKDPSQAQGNSALQQNGPGMGHRF